VTTNIQVIPNRNCYSFASHLTWNLEELDLKVICMAVRHYHVSPVLREAEGMRVQHAYFMCHQYLSLSRQLHNRVWVRTADKHGASWSSTDTCRALYNVVFDYMAFTWWNVTHVHCVLICDYEHKCFSGWHVGTCTIVHCVSLVRYMSVLDIALPALDGDSAHRSGMVGRADDECVGVQKRDGRTAECSGQRPLYCDVTLLWHGHQGDGVPMTTGGYMKIGYMNLAFILLKWLK